jgi:hypothetical protein
VDAKTRDRALQELECYADVSLSARVAGTVRDQIVHATNFYQVSEGGWDHFVHSPDSPLRLGRAVTRSFKDPFPLSRKKGLVADQLFKGYLPSIKGEESWRVLDYKDLKDLESWGGAKRDGVLQDHRIICYKDGVLGVAVRVDTGERVKVNSLKAYRSMYGSGKPPLKLKRASVGGAAVGGAAVGGAM